MHDLRSALIVEPDPHAVALHAAGHVVASAHASITARGVFTLALTGGSSPLDLYDLLARDPFRSQIDWARTQIFYGDERAVAPDDANSNHAGAWQHLLRHVPLPQDHVHRMQGERHADLEQAAADYAHTLRRIAGDTVYPSLDLVLLGIGGDGHILSMYPHCPEIDRPSGAVVALRNPPMNPAIDRISFTPPMLDAARGVLLIATGGSKKTALARALQTDGPMDEVPARLVARTRGALTVLADRAAAG